MAVPSHSHRRVGAQHRAKLKKWSDKRAREDGARAIVASQDAPVRPHPRRTLEAAKSRLRRLFR